MPNIILVGAGLDQIPIIEEAHKMGVKVLALDGRENAEGFVVSDWHECVDIKNADAVVEIAKQYNKDIGIHGCLTAGVEVCETVGSVIDELKLPGIGAFIAGEMTDKYRRYANLYNLGNPWVFIPNHTRRQCTMHGTFSSPSILDHLDNRLLTLHRKKIGIPCVVKTETKGSGARNIYYVDSTDQLKQFENLECIIEEYIDGHELSVESYIDYFGRDILVIADRNYDKKFKYKPYMIEDGFQIPTILHHDIKFKVCETIRRVIKCFDLKNCVLKCDLIIKDNNVYVIECVPRMSGGKFGTEGVQLASNKSFNPIVWAINCSLGSMAFGKVYPLDQIPVAQRYYFPQGKEIKSHHDRGPSFIATGETVEEAVKRAEDMVKDYGERS